MGRWFGIIFGLVVIFGTIAVVSIAKRNSANPPPLDYKGVHIQDNARVYLMTAGESIAPMSDYLRGAVIESDWSDAQCAEAERILRSHRKAFASIDEMLKRDYAPAPYLSIEQPLPELSHFRSLQKLLLIDAKVAKKRGDRQRAVKRFDQALRMATMTMQHGRFIELLVGNSLINRAVTVATSEWDWWIGNDPQLGARLQATAKRFPPMSAIIIEEKMAGQAFLLEAFDSGKWMKPYSEEAGFPERAKNVVRQWFTNRQSVYAEYGRAMDELAGAADGHQLRHVASNYPDIVTPMIDTAHGIHRGRLGAINLLELAAGDAAIKSFKRSTGRWPKTLDELVPRFLPRLPTDPLSPDGLPLRYGATENGFKLYSVGHNGTDDGGVSTKDEENRTDRAIVGAQRETGDITSEQLFVKKGSSK